MALAPGTKLGPFEIAAPLGAGGMGEVYRARDTRLDRDVAIKVLPEALAADPDRLRRFEPARELCESSRFQGTLDARTPAESERRKFSGMRIAAATQYALVAGWCARASTSSG